VGGDPQSPATLGPAVAEIRVLVDVGLVYVDQQMPIALGAVQHALELLDKGLPPLWIGPAQQLLGFLPRQLEAVQGRSDRLTAAEAAEALAHKRHQPLEGEAGRRVGAIYGRSGCPALGGVHDLAEAGLDLGAKGGRPPVR
jgi:hypothetical protein